MESNKVSAYLLNLDKYVPNNKKIVLKNALSKASPESEENLSQVKLTDPVVVLICSIFLGIFGVDRFMIGDIGLGVCKLLFGWLTLFIWPLVDIFYTANKAREKNLQSILLLLN